LNRPPLSKPPALERGATIGVAAISGPVDEARLNAGIGRLEAKGYRIVEASNLRRRSGIFAGTDAERAEGYLELVRSPSVDAIFFARGGYGAARVLPLLPASEVRANPKIHLGGSDLTGLFAWLDRAAGLVSFYGPMVAVEMPSEDGLDWEAVLAGELPAAHRFLPEDVLSPGSADGPIVGGCLSLLASLAGTPQNLSAEGSILFWEDVGEPAYRLDRMITQLEQAGTFDRLRGMVIGSLVPPAGEAADALRRWLADRFRGAPFPVAMNVSAGHLARPRTLPLGLRVLLTLDGEGGLSYPETGVKLP
jgi:muramoyltetrapeptide carboxypeptidase